MFSKILNELKLSPFAIFIIALLLNTNIMSIYTVKTYKEKLEKTKTELNQCNIKMSEVVNKVIFLEQQYFQTPVIDQPQKQKEIKIRYEKKKQEIIREREITKIQKIIRKVSKYPFSDDYLRLISSGFYDASVKFNVNYLQLIAVAYHESRFFNDRTSKVGAKGIMQVMPFWTKDNNFNLKTNVHFPEDLDDPYRNIFAGTYVYKHYLDYWRKKGYTGKRLRKIALLSYNRGAQRVRYLLKKGKDPENGYFRKVNAKFINLQK